MYNSYPLYNQPNYFRYEDEFIRKFGYRPTGSELHNYMQCYALPTHSMPITEASYPIQEKKSSPKIETNEKLLLLLDEV